MGCWAPPESKQNISNSSSQTDMPFPWCHVWPDTWQDRTMQSSFFVKHLAAASSFSICKMYIFNAGLCRSSVMALTQGQGFESYCGCPLSKYALSLCFNAISLGPGVTPVASWEELQCPKGKLQEDVQVEICNNLRFSLAKCSLWINGCECTMNTHCLHLENKETDKVSIKKLYSRFCVNCVATCRDIPVFL